MPLIEKLKTTATMKLCMFYIVLSLGDGQSSWALGLQVGSELELNPGSAGQALALGLKT